MSSKEGEKKEIDIEGSDTVLEESTQPTVRRSQRETKKVDHYGERVYTATSVSIGVAIGGLGGFRKGAKPPHFIIKL